MMVTTVWLLLVILSENVNSVTVIQANVTWDDTILASSYEGTYTDPSLNGGDYWFYPEYVVDRNDDLGSHIVASPNGNNPAVWGWWGRWTQTVNTGYTEDPDRSMSRYFECSSFGQVTIELDLYLCIDTNAKNAGGTTTIYYKRNSATSGNKIINAEYNKNGNYDGWFKTGNGNSPQGTNCNVNIHRAHVTDTFNVGGIGDLFFITINWEANGESNTETYHVAAFNNLQITCTQYPTNAPTNNPTEPTGVPSISPTKNPTPAPTENPTPAPTANPTKNPITPIPTKSPSTLIPSKTPSKTPTNDPTQSPTTDPTKDPTPKPTPRPITSPTSKPTAKQGFDEQVENAFGGNNDCNDGWVQCNLLIFILLLLIIICFLLYWILGAVWYKRRQNNRPLPPYLMNQDQTNNNKNNNNNNNVEMGGTGGTGGTGVAAHTTANKWKSAWELEQDAKTDNTGVNDGNDGNDGW